MYLLLLHLRDVVYKCYSLCIRQTFFIVLQPRDNRTTCITYYYRLTADLISVLQPDLQDSEAQIKKDFEAYISPLREHHHANGDVLGMDNPPMLEQPVFAIEWGK